VLKESPKLIDESQTKGIELLFTDAVSHTRIIFHIWCRNRKISGLTSRLDGFGVDLDVGEEVF
jgi:hypothetical protein